MCLYHIAKKFDLVLHEKSAFLFDYNQIIYYNKKRTMEVRYGFKEKSGIFVEDG